MERVMTTWWNKNMSQFKKKKKKSNSQSPKGEQQHEEVSLSSCHPLCFYWILMTEFGCLKLDVWPGPTHPLKSMPSSKESPGQNGEQRGHQDGGQSPRPLSPSTQETKTEAIFNAITQPLMTTDSINHCNVTLRFKNLHAPAFCTCLLIFSHFPST